ncbi:MAG: class II fructose-bisphosphate aldolase [Enterocloster bolteae]
MKLSPMKDILEMAEERNIAYGAYVTVSYETALAAIEAGTELIFRSSLSQVRTARRFTGGFEGTVDTVKRAMKAADCKVPVALHLDHCRTYVECVQAIQADILRHA